MKRKRAQPVFKEYTMGQLVLLPVNLDELIPPEHLVRVIHTFVEQMDLTPLLAQYKGGGTSSYHPKMMLKVFLYAYTQKIFSSRRIAKALRENLAFIWLSGHQQPDFHTLNAFRGHVLQGVIDAIFQALLELLVEHGYIQLEEYFVDGTKLEANANRYTFVWAKNTRRYQKQLGEKVAALVEQIEQLNAAENARYGECDLEELGNGEGLDPAQLSQCVAALNEHLHAPQPDPQHQAEPKDEPPAGAAGGGDLPGGLLSQTVAAELEKVQQALAQQPENQALAKAAKVLGQEYLPRAQKYESQERWLAGRNSYAKTDPDATFMRMKDDAMKNGQVKPAYNIQIGTEHQFVVGYSLHQEAGDPTCLIPHLEKLKQLAGRLPHQIVGDAAYGSEENYAYLEREGLDSYLKYNTFDREQKKRYHPDPFKAEHMPYDPEQDVFTCPNGQPLTYQATHHPKTKNGYRIEQRVYACGDCQGCPVKAHCTRAAGNRQLHVSFQAWAYRQQARENLLSVIGQKLRAARGVEVETVFGRIKEDWGFRRFLLRGLEKVGIEWGLLSMAHNLAKVWTTLNGPALTTL
jgi:transposase